MNSQKSAIIIIKSIILKRTVKKKISSKNHKDLSVSQIQIQTLNQILSQIQLSTAIKVDNSETQLRFRQWESV